MSRRRRPPYHRRMAALLANQDRWGRYAGSTQDAVTVWVATGPNAWDQAKRWAAETPPRLFLLCPPGEDPTAFDWSILSDHPPVLISAAGPTPRADIEALAAAILRDGCKRVLAMVDGRIVRYTPDMEEAAA